MKKLFYYFLLFSFLISCNNHNEEDVFFFSLSESTINADCIKTVKTIQVSASNQNWTINELSLPEWCNVERKSISSDDVTVTILPNHKLQAREVTITFICNNNILPLYIFQKGAEKDSSLDLHSFTVNTFLESNKIDDNNYRIIASELYINPTIKEKIFHGNLIDNSITNIYGIKDFNKYSYNPITISSFSNGHVYYIESVQPSSYNTNKLYSEIKNSLPDQNLSFIYQSAPIRYNSYKHLNLLGVGNLGIKLDEVMTGKSYLTSEMENKTGLIYNYCNILFNTTIDLPRNLISDAITAEEKEKLSYINNIKYGRMAFLIIETDYDYQTSISVIAKIMKRSKLSSQEEEVKNSITAYYFFFNNDGNINVDSGLDVIGKYVSEINNQPIIPLSFSINKYNNAINLFQISLTQ